MPAVGALSSQEYQERIAPRLAATDPRTSQEADVQLYHKLNKTFPGGNPPPPASTLQRDPKEFVDEYVEEKVSVPGEDSTRYSSYRRY